MKAWRERYAALASLIATLVAGCGFYASHFARRIFSPNSSVSKVTAKPVLNAVWGDDPGLDPQQSSMHEYSRNFSEPTTSYGDITMSVSREAIVNPAHDSLRTVAEHPLWWRKSLSFQSYQLPRSTSSQSFSELTPRVGVGEDFKKHVQESKKVSLTDFLRESPDEYGAQFRIRVQGSEGRHQPSIHIDLDLAETVIRAKEVETVYSDIRKLLRTAAGLHAFFSFLRLNLSAENLLFYQTVADLRLAVFNHAADRLCLSLVSTIFDEFVKLDAPCMINIGGDKQAKIASEVTLANSRGFVHPELLELIVSAQTEVFELMEKDLFPRFLASSEAGPWKDECRRVVDEIHKSQPLLPQSVRKKPRLKRWRSLPAFWLWS